MWNNYRDKWGCYTIDYVRLLRDWLQGRLLQDALCEPIIEMNTVWNDYRDEYWDIESKETERFERHSTDGILKSELFNICM